MVMVCPECGSADVTWELVGCERFVVCEACSDAVLDGLLGERDELREALER